MAQIPMLHLDDEDLGTDDLEALIRVMRGTGLGRQRVRFDSWNGRPCLIAHDDRFSSFTRTEVPAVTPRKRAARGRGGRS